MNGELKKAVQKSQAVMHEAHSTEREAFKALLLTNPNYFGNLAQSPFTPVLPIAGNTYYEELGCVGYHPQQKRYEAVVYINQPTGYGTDVCGPGTPECVRFYLSYDNGATWHDQGLTSFQAFNIPQGTEGSKRLEYAVSLPAEVPPRFCFFDPLVRVRAILSWNNMPPPNQPNWVPIWGNVREVNILIQPFHFLPWPVFLEIGKVKLPQELAEIIALDTPIKTQPKSLDAVVLASLYREKGIPAHRFAFKELSHFLSSQTTLSAEELATLLPNVNIDPNIIGQLFPPTHGDTSYEELKCIGLDPNLPNTLVGILQIKRPAGYSGGPCTNGSTEYVTFWADSANNGTFSTCLGTAQVQVYDIANIPPEGIYYAVRLPVDLTPFCLPCQEGPRVVHIRATLSWSVPAPCFNPNYVPVWGNREETLVNINPCSLIASGKIAVLGGIPVSAIDSTTGLTTSQAVFALNNLPPDPYGRPCPFGGRVTAQGAPMVGHSYIVEVSLDQVLWTPVLTNLEVTDEYGNVSVYSANPITKRFDYLPFQKNINGLLAQWDTSGDSRWWVRLSVYDAANNLVGTDVHRIQLDNTAPTVAIDITTGTGDCGKFTEGTQLAGNFVAQDAYLGSYGLSVLPSINAPNTGIPVPHTGLNNTALSPGDPWTLNTTGMKSCGYVIAVGAWDRAILDSQHVGHYNEASVGFCLEEPA